MTDPDTVPENPEPQHYSLELELGDFKDPTLQAPTQQDLGNGDIQ